MTKIITWGTWFDFLNDPKQNQSIRRRFQSQQVLQVLKFLANRCGPASSDPSVCHVTRMLRTFTTSPNTKKGRELELKVWNYRTSIELNDMKDTV